MNWDLIVTIGLAAGGAVWAVRGKLSDIERALHGHVERSDERHRDHDTRIVRLEDYRKRL